MKKLICAALSMIIATFVITKANADAYQNAYEHYKKGDFDKAKSIIYDNIEKSNEAYKFHYLNGLIKYQQKNYLFAKNELIKSINLKSDFIPAITKKADIEMIFMNYKDAITDYKNTIKLGYNEFDVYLKIAEAYYKSDSINQAKIYVNKSLKLKETPDAYALRANIKTDIYKYKRDENIIDSAVEDMNKAISLDKENYYFYYMKSMLYLKVEKFILAIENMKIALEKNPKFAKGYLDLGKINQSIGNDATACNNYNKALALGDSRAKYLIENICSK